MKNKKCPGCKIFTLLAAIGAINWALVAFLDLNLVEKIAGVGTTLSKVIYGLVGLSGLMLIVSCAMCCPMCPKDSSCGSDKK